jgi:hypothetical protein
MPGGTLRQPARAVVFGGDSGGPSRPNGAPNRGAPRGGRGGAASGGAPHLPAQCTGGGGDVSAGGGGGGERGVPLRHGPRHAAGAGTDRVKRLLKTTPFFWVSGFRF